MAFSYKQEQLTDFFPCYINLFPRALHFSKKNSQVQSCLKLFLVLLKSWGGKSDAKLYQRHVLTHLLNIFLPAFVSQNQCIYAKTLSLNRCAQYSFPHILAVNIFTKCSYFFLNFSTFSSFLFLNQPFALSIDIGVRKVCMSVSRAFL